MRHPVLALSLLVMTSGCAMFERPRAITFQPDPLAKLDANEPIELVPAHKLTPPVVVAAPIVQPSAPATIAYATPHPAAAPIRYSTSPRKPTTTTKKTPTLAIASSRTHKVRKGETLQKISRKHYGTTKRWVDIYNANSSTLRSPDKIVVGMLLRIP